MYKTAVYQNGMGEEIVFGAFPYFANPQEMTNFGWQKDEEAFSRTEQSRSFDVTIVGARASVAQARNELCRICDYDTSRGDAGRFYVGDYWLNCNLTEVSTKDCTNGHILMTVALTPSGAAWHCENPLQYIVGARTQPTTDGVGKGFPHGFPYGYVGGGRGQDVVRNTFDSPAAFRLIIYGPCVQPEIIIAGHTYKMLLDLDTGERCVVDSTTKKITRYAPDNTAFNVFAKRYKPESIFEEIPRGTSVIQWDKTFGFDLVLVDARSEPVWR